MKKSTRSPSTAPIDASFLHRMANGVPILDTTTLPCRIRQDTKTRFTLILTQGLNRQIRRMCEALGYGVAHLRRTRIMNIHLGDLPTGRWRDLTPAELTDMHRRLSKSSKTPLALPDARRGLSAPRSLFTGGGTGTAARCRAPRTR
jgi:16S rRNA U516 pseudouridylate synthase RsuA-like enzyme